MKRGKRKLVNPYHPSSFQTNANAASGIRYICIACQCCEAQVDDKLCGDCYRVKLNNQSQAKKEVV